MRAPNHKLHSFDLGSVNYEEGENRWRTVFLFTGMNQQPFPTVLSCHFIANRCESSVSHEIGEFLVRVQACRWACRWCRPVCSEFP